jgi:magnesium-transporting ATPase (P-type)
MLTGDKLETAIEIAKACNLIGSDYEVILFRKSSKDIRDFIRES